MKGSKIWIGLVLLTSLMLVVTGCSNKGAPTASLQDEDGSIHIESVRDDALGPLPNAIDDVKLIGDDGSETVYEDAEDGSTHRWFIYWSSPGNATFANEFDAVRNSRVITFYDAGDNVRYALGNGEGDTIWNSIWNNSKQFILQWSLRYDEYFEIYVRLRTNTGDIWLKYVPGDAAPAIINGIGYIGLGVNAADGAWHDYQRDLRTDLNTLFPDNELLAVRFIKLSSNTDDTPPPSWEARTPGFWKNNIRKVILQGKKKGTQVTKAELNQYLDTIHKFYLSPYETLTFEKAYAILNNADKSPVGKLKKHLLATEFNFAAGAYLNNNVAQMVLFLRAGEDMILNPGTTEEILTLKDHYDHFNNNDFVLWE